MELIGCEALLRWNNPGRGRISPDIFIPLAEQGSMIKFLTEWVLDHAIKNCSDWHKSGKFISVSVNLSARLLIEESIVDTVSHYLQKHVLSPNFLILEITESAMMVDPVKARYILTQLAALGVSLSIDDFGTGYTSISQIQNMPVNEIKIDKSFVLNMLNNPGDANLVKLIIDMGHGMGHKVTAEGIEDQEILDHLKNMGCDIAQGYYLGKPMPLAEFNLFRLGSI
jgi:EAL domain-containing protein (putative c-di-GMP-specific phosphodiesterase class I)